MAREDDARLGARVRDARRQAGYSQAQIAAALAIPRSAVSLLESGDRSLASHELARLSQIFGWSVESLLFGDTAEQEAVEDRGEGAVLRFFRTAGNLNPADEGWLAEAEGRWRRYAAVEWKVFGAQRHELPVYPVPAGRPYEQGERLAEQERRRLGLGSAPIRSMVDLLEGEGIKVLLLSFRSGSEASGGYFFSHELGPCVVIDADELPSRRRFTEGHEYCHFLVDRGEVDGEICSHGRRREHFEMRANAFAAAFLMPADGIAEALEGDGVDRGRIGPEDVVHLMYRFGVSFQAILWRLLNLSWIDGSQRERLAQISPTKLAARLGYEHEPGQVEPRPDRERRLAVDAWRSGQLSDREVATVVGMSVGELKRTFGVTNLDNTTRRPRRGPVEDPDWF